MKKIGLGSRPSELKGKDKKLDLSPHYDEEKVSEPAEEKIFIPQKRLPQKRILPKYYFLLLLILVSLLGASLLALLTETPPAESTKSLFSFQAALDYVEFVSGDKSLTIKKGEKFEVNYTDGLSIKKIACTGWYKLFPPDDISAEISGIGALQNLYLENFMPVLKPELSTNYDLIVSRGANQIGTVSFTIKMDAEDWLARAEAIEDKEIKNICLKNAVSANPESENARIELAKSFEEKKQPANAIDEYEEIVKKNPRNKEALEALVPLYSKTRKTDKLIEIYKSLAQLDEEKADQYYFKAAAAAEKNKQTAEAIDLYKKSLSANRANIDAREKLINLYEKQNQWNQVAAQTRELLKLDPNNSNLYLYLSEAYLKTNQLDRAISAVEKAAKLKPKDAAIQLQCALLYEKAKNEDKAIEAYKKLASLNHKNPTVYNNLGLMLEKKGDRRSAIKNYEKAASLDPDNKVFRLNLADAYEKQKDWDKAIREYEKITKLDKKNVSAWEALAVLYQKKKRNADVIKAYKELSRIEPKKLLWHQKLASMYENQGNFAEAKKEYEAILKLNPKDKAAKQKHLDLSIKTLQTKQKK